MDRSAMIEAGFKAFRQSTLHGLRLRAVRHDIDVELLLSANVASMRATR